MSKQRPSQSQNPFAHFDNRSAHVAVIGLGYVGLPLVVALAEAGYRVTGIDIDKDKVDAVNRGVSYIDDIPSARLARLVQPATNGQPPERRRNGAPNDRAPGMTGQVNATSDYDVLADCDAVSICVPTPLNKTGAPDVSYIAAAVRSVARYLHPGMVVILESTTYPGTTREVVLPILQGDDANDQTDGGRLNVSALASAGQYRERQAVAPRADRSGKGGREWIVGQDFFLAFSPERIDPGRTDWTIETTPKVIGGITPACTRAASACYAPAIRSLVPVSSPDAAEMTKLFENTFRMVNIGLANELLLMCDKLGLDAWEVLDAAATKPFGFMKFTPGPGLGGHCIPVDPHYLSWKLKGVEYTARFIELASQINTEMPRYWVQRVQDRLNDHGKPLKGSSVLVLGVAYKKDVADLRESPALDIIHLLRQKGAAVSYHDPHVPTLTVDDLDLVCVPDLDKATAAADCVVIVTDHSTYDWNTTVARVPVVVDTRRVLPRTT